MAVGNYYNTTQENGEQLEMYRTKTLKQDQLVLKVFEGFGRLTPSEAYECMITRAPLTSIRRAITNLTRCGRLCKTNEKKVGPQVKPFPKPQGRGSDELLCADTGRA